MSLCGEFLKAWAAPGNCAAAVYSRKLVANEVLNSPFSGRISVLVKQKPQVRRYGYRIR